MKEGLATCFIGAGGTAGAGVPVGSADDGAFRVALDVGGTGVASATVEAESDGVGATVEMP